MNGFQPLSNVNIGRWLKTCRKGSGYKLREVAAMADISVSYLSDIERGRTEPSLKVFVSLLYVYGMELYIGQSLKSKIHELQSQVDDLQEKWGIKY